ncbi:MAG: CoA transferase [Endomicrobiia bacterium]|nr:CoA transferase [Endomicrobiia bacterium]
MKNPLEGVKVIDFTRVLSGPYCTMMLADMGADIIKIERPKTGDDSRSFGPLIAGESGYFISVNRGKKSVVLDLKTDAAKAAVKKLCLTSDVLVENFRPGAMKKLGLDYESLKELNPRLIFCSITGYGQDGPVSQYAGYDVIAQAVGGMMSITGYPDTPPTRVGTSIADVLSGMFAAYGIVSALHGRQTSGQGARIDISMVDSVMAVLENAVVRYGVSGKTPERIGSKHPSLCPFDIYEAKDGYIAIAAGNDSLWREFATAIKREDIIFKKEFETNELRCHNEKKLKKIIEDYTRAHAIKDLLNNLNKHGIPCGPVNDIARAVRHSQVLHRNMIVELDQKKIGKIKVAGTPVKITGLDDKNFSPAPLLGEHTDEVLAKL